MLLAAAARRTAADRKQSAAIKQRFAGEHARPTELCYWVGSGTAHLPSIALLPEALLGMNKQSVGCAVLRQRFSYDPRVFAALAAFLCRRL